MAKDRTKARLKLPLYAGMAFLSLAISTYAAAQEAAARAETAPAAQASPTPPPAVPQKQEAVSVPVRLGTHGGFTRIVFDMPRLTAYNLSGNVVTFDTQDNFSLPRGKTVQIRSMKITGPGQITMGVPDGAKFKHYRLGRKVIIDVYASAPKEEKPETPAPAPAPAPGKIAEAAPVAKPEETKPAPLPEKAEEAETGTAAPIAETAEAAPTMPGVPAAAVEEVVATPEEATVISISTLEPARLAVFSRFDTLWIVMESSTGSAENPEIKGPQAGLLGKPRILKFEGGTAYRYQMPPGAHVFVDKKNLTWSVSLTSYLAHPVSNAQINVEFDDTSKKAKLLIPLKGGGKVLEIEDPSAGDKIFTVAVDDPANRVDQSRRFTDVSVIPSQSGTAVAPLADDVRINRIQDFVLITSEDGIVATPAAAVGPTMVLHDPGTQDAGSEAVRLFDFPNWRQGGISRLNENRRNLENQIAAAATPQITHEMLTKLALLYFANGFGHEALAVLRLIEQNDPESSKNANFIALRGAVKAMAGHYAEAMQDFSDPSIKDNPEVKLWSGYVAATTEQWHKANDYFPRNNLLLMKYPENLSAPFTIYMAESALRLGRTDTAKTLLDTLGNLEGGGGDPHHVAAINYLRGEIARQEGKPEEAARIWRPVAMGLDRLYHAKGSLALANLELHEKKITLKEAIDRIDSLRFAWRGDGLEVQILHNLGRLKTENGQFLAGLEDMKSASELAEAQLGDPDPIRADIYDTFNKIFSGDGAVKITPLEAVSVYNAFGSLIPPGDAGSAMMLKVADALISIDLLEKAQGIIDGQISGGYVPADKIPATGAKLAAVYLLDGKPESALTALDKTAGGSGISVMTIQERTLLRARAQSKLGQPEAAIQTLADLDSRDTRLLRADILWRAGKWAEAATAIEKSLTPPETDKPLSSEAAEMVLNAAVAYKLAGDSAGLQNLRGRYIAAMASSPLSTTFGVVTRDSGNVTLGDRETVLKIAGEVDMFKGFLDNYKAADKGS